MKFADKYPDANSYPVSDSAESVASYPDNVKAWARIGNCVTCGAPTRFAWFYLFYCSEECVAKRGGVLVGGEAR